MNRILNDIELRTSFLESVHKYVNVIITFIANFINFNLLNSVQLYEPAPGLRCPSALH